MSFDHTLLRTFRLNPAKGRNSTSILHVPPWLERQVMLFFVCEKFFAVSTSNKKKNQSWNKDLENGITEIRTANP